ncbi:MAG: LuxR family transcriptional regulator [Rhodobacteraceae bacterium]|nr:LuxR family transcriptional regulator [Paracoccaceae bacterium]
MFRQVAEDFAKELDDAACDRQLAGALETVSRRIGFDHFALNLEAHSAEFGTSAVLLHDYPGEWASVYTTFELAGRDPVRRACDRSFSGFAWERIKEFVPLTRGDSQMLAIGRECGIGDGFTVPRHLPGRVRGSCTFAVGPDNKLPHEFLQIAEVIGAMALTHALRFIGMVSEARPPQLSDRQRECLLWIARGKTAAETAIILGISPETVNQHLKLARERYSVHCCQSLILSALFDGLIGFSDIFHL